MSKLMNVREVAATLGVGWRTVLRLADRGEMAWGLKVGATLRRWTPEMVEAYIRQQAEKCGKAAR